MYPLLKPPRIIKLQPDYPVVYVTIGKETKPIPVNESAASILMLCNGVNDISTMVKQLVEKYQDSEETVSTFVNDFLKHPGSLHTVEWIDNATEHDITAIGSSDYWTPDIIVLELTHNCPLVCKHCYLDAGRGETLDRELITRINQEIVDLGVDSVQLTGGEPLVYPYIKEVIDFFNENHVKLLISTSGVVSNPEILDAMSTIKECGGRVQVSIDGSEKTHNLMRGKDDCYSSSVSFIKELVDRGVNVDACTCVTNDSLDELDDICRQAKEWGCHAHRISFVSERGRAIINGFHTSSKLRESMKKKREELKEHYGSNDFNVTGIENDLIEVRPENINCGLGSRTLKIAPDGRVHPCPMMNWPIGNLYDNKLLDIIKQNSKRFATILPPGKELCGSCSMLPHCNDCVAEALLYCRTMPDCKWNEQGVGLMFEEDRQHYLPLAK